MHYNEKVASELKALYHQQAIHYVRVIKTCAQEHEQPQQWLETIKQLISISTPHNHPEVVLTPLVAKSAKFVPMTPLPQNRYRFINQNPAGRALALHAGEAVHFENVWGIVRDMFTTGEESDFPPYELDEVVYPSEHLFCGTCGEPTYLRRLDKTVPDVWLGPCECTS